MKNNSQIMIMAIFASILLFAASSYAQVRVGGYKAVPTDDPKVIEAAEYAANIQTEQSGTNINIETIETAARQVVAGTNYRICLQVAVGEENEKPAVQVIQTIVFYSLQQKFSLRSWTRVKSCG